VSSGLGFVPLAIMPVYCASKAAMHSFTLSLRHQLKNSCIKVFEIIPPTVDTELDRGTRAARGMNYSGISPKDCAAEAFKGIQNDTFEITVGQASNLVNASGNAFWENFNSMNY
jgi:uncharacterized oxidoreductase